MRARGRLRSRVLSFFAVVFQLCVISLIASVAFYKHLCLRVCVQVCLFFSFLVVCRFIAFKSPFMCYCIIFLLFLFSCVGVCVWGFFFVFRFMQEKLFALKRQMIAIIEWERVKDSEFEIKRWILSSVSSHNDFAAIDIYAEYNIQFFL